VAVPDTTYQLKGISPRALQHPADRAATAALHQIPYLDQVIKKLIQLGYERALRQSYLGSSVRLGQEQLPKIWVLEREVFNVLDLPEVPDLYLTQMPFANAFTIGAGEPIIVLNSELVELLDTEGLRAVIAHEATHVLAEHVLYGTALQILLGLSARLPLLAGLPLMAVRAALLEWSRAAELTCDRGAAVVTRQPMAVANSLMALAGGQAAADLNLDAFIAQGLEYREKGSGLEKLTRLLLDMNITHPMPVRRIHELLKWVREGEYDRIVDGSYVRRGEEPPPREEAEAAQQHYGERVRDAVRSAGTSVQEVGEQLGDWLSKQRKTGGSGSSGSSGGSSDS
jgi:Zn-dependent protease with chaperone function